MLRISDIVIGASTPQTPITPRRVCAPSARESNSRASSANSIEGVPATGLLLLIDPDDRRACWVSLYETEEDMHKGDGILNQRSPPGEGLGRCTSIKMYEVAVDARS